MRITRRRTRRPDSLASPSAVGVISGAAARIQPASYP